MRISMSGKARERWLIQILKEAKVTSSYQKSADFRVVQPITIRTSMGLFNLAGSDRFDPSHDKYLRVIQKGAAFRIPWDSIASIHIEGQPHPPSLPGVEKTPTTV